MNQVAVQLHDEALKLMPEGATHDAASCPICADQASASETPPAPGSSDVTTSEPASQEGGKNQVSEITQETHDALVKQAVERATEEASARIAELETNLNTVTKERDEVLSEVATLREENEEINGKLDTAQVELQSAKDENASLKEDIAERDEQARLSEIASTRAQQVRNLGLFSEEHITEKATKWAAVPEDDWAERLEEWKTVKGEGTPSDGSSTATPTTDTASALSGTTEADQAAEEKPKSARRAVLGLT